jgi:hypothetical protein
MTAMFWIGVVCGFGLLVALACVIAACMLSSQISREEEAAGRGEQ